MSNAFPIVLTGAFAICLGVTAATPSVADHTWNCKAIPVGVSVFSRMADAPSSVVRALTDRIGEIVPVGAPFDATDVVKIGKSRRLIFVWNRGTRWVVAIEHGGFAYMNENYAFEIDQQGRARPVRDDIGDPCWIAPRLIEDAPAK